MRPIYATIGAIALVALNLLLFVLDGTRFAVVPLQLLVAGLSFGPVLAITVALLPAVAFFCWGVWPRKAAPRVGWFAISAFAVVTVVAGGAVLGYWSWSAGELSTFVGLADVAFVLGLISAALMNIRTHSISAAVCFHWLLFAWIATYAFPYRGELP